MDHGIINLISAAGVVGTGGGGFPTYIKLGAPAEVVILNAAECEPLLHKDKEVLRQFPTQVLDGLRLAMHAVGAKRGIVGVKGKYHDLIASLQPLLGSLELMELSDTYPAGDEFVLVYDTLGKVIAPGALPLSVGAVVLNVETAFNIHQSEQGPVTDKFLTVAGAVASPSTFYVPIGMSFRHLIEAAGGATVEGEPAVLVGGVMMGELELNLDAPVTKTTGGLVVLPQNHPLVQRRRWSEKQIRQIGRSACDQCSFCTEFCPRYLLGHPVEPHKAMRTLGFSRGAPEPHPGTQFCCECNLCSMYACPEDLDPRNVCALSRRKILAGTKKWENPPLDRLRARNVLSFRRVPIPRLIKRIGLAGFTNAGPLRLDVNFEPSQVVLPLKQHTGPPAVSMVKAGDRVTKGQLIARPTEGKLGANLHAPVAGSVMDVSEKSLVIKT